MTQIHDYSMLHGDSIPLDSLHFVFIGDPSLEDTGIWAPSAADPSQSNLEHDLASLIGPEKTDHILTALGIVANDGIGQQVLGNVTPTDLYPTTIYTLDGDSVAQFQQVFESRGLLGTIWHLFTTHVEYLGLTPEDIAAATTTTDGNLTLCRHPRHLQQRRRVAQRGIRARGRRQRTARERVAVARTLFDQLVLT